MRIVLVHSYGYKVSLFQLVLCDFDVKIDAVFVSVFLTLLSLAAYKHADGKKIDGKRVVVDVERGRTVKSWKPRRLGKYFLHCNWLCIEHCRYAVYSRLVE